MEDIFDPFVLMPSTAKTFALSWCDVYAAKVKVMYLRGALLAFSMPLELSFATMLLSSTLSQLRTYPLCSSALNDTTYNQSEMCPLKNTDFCLFLYH